MTSLQLFSKIILCNISLLCLCFRYTKFYQDGAMIVDCQCMRNAYLYTRYTHEPTDKPVKPGTLTRCLGRKTSGIVGKLLQIIFSMLMAKCLKKEKIWFIKSFIHEFLL